MEQLHAKKDSWLAWSLFVCMVLMLSMSLTACGGKKKSGTIGSTPSATNPDNVNPNCTDCGNYTDELAAGLNLGYKIAGINLEMSLVTYAPASNASNTGVYTGPVVVRGFLKVLNDVTLFSPMGEVCTLKAGEYDVYTAQAGGQYSNASTFELGGIQAEIKHRGNGEKFPLHIDYLEYTQSAQRSFVEGGATYKYPLSFFGQTYFCGPKNIGKSIFFPING